MSQKLSKRALKHKREVTQAWIQNRCDKDATYKALRSVRALLSQTFKRFLKGQNPRSKRLESITGRTTSELMNHLLSTAPSDFKPDLYGSQFEVDHCLRPLSAFQKIPLPNVAIALAFAPSNLRIVHRSKNRPGRNAGKKA